MKIKRFIALVAFFMMMFTVTAFATQADPTIFLGEIVEVNMDAKQENTRLLVRGYIRGCEIYQEELIANVSKNTLLMTSCGKQVEELKFEKGDKVFIELSQIMTPSIPPQSPAMKIQVTKATEKPAEN